MYQIIRQVLLKPFALNWRQLAFLCCLVVSGYFISASAYIYLKAHLAQILIGNAWHTTLEKDEVTRPWSWADTYPVAKLSIHHENLFVLAGATGRTLAFGPGHLSHTPLPGVSGNSVFTGHRDTHFSVLQKVALNDEIRVQTQWGNFRYLVYQIDKVHYQDISIVQASDFDQLTLITCYPFDGIEANTPWRYVVMATRINERSQNLNAKKHS